MSESELSYTLFNGSFETYTSYYEFDDNQKKKKVLGGFNSIFLGSGNSIFDFLKKGPFGKKFATPCSICLFRYF